MVAIYLKNDKKHKKVAAEYSCDESLWHKIINVS